MAKSVANNQIIGGKSQHNKIIELIKHSYKTGARIICANKQQADLIFEQAKEAGYKIKKPMSYIQFRYDRIVYEEEIIVDEIEQVLKQVLSANVILASTSMEMNEIQEEENNNNKHIKADDVIKMLKMIQREARKAKKALRELETASKKIEECNPKWILQEGTKEMIKSINNALDEVELKTLDNGSYYYEKKYTSTPWSNGDCE